MTKLNNSKSRQVEKGNDYIIRYPNKEDVYLMHQYINTLSTEQTFINYQGEEITLKEEKEYLYDQIKRIKQNKSVQLIILADDKIVGSSSVDMGYGASSHEATLGISILNEYRSIGLGNRLLKLIIDEAKMKLIGLKIITLTLFSNNESAFSLYKKYGFKEFGRLKNGIFYKDKTFDRIYMMLEV